MYVSHKEYKKFLKEKDPESYRAMEMAGTLNQFCREKIDQAREEYETILMDLIRRTPQKEDYLEEVKEQQAPQGLAREIAIAHLFELD